MTAISTRAISRSTCAPEPPLVQPDNQSLLLSARSPDSIQRYAPPARSGSSAPPPPSAAGAPFPSPTTSRYSGACAISPPRAPGAPRSASALPSNIASPTTPRSRVVSLAIAACARTSSLPGATPPFSTSKCSTLAEPRDYAGFKPFGALAPPATRGRRSRCRRHRPRHLPARDPRRDRGLPCSHDGAAEAREARTGRSARGEPLDQVDLRHDRRDLISVLDDRHLVLREQLPQPRHRRPQRHHPVDGLHHRADRLVQLVPALEQRLQEVHLVQHGHRLVT